MPKRGDCAVERLGRAHAGCGHDEIVLEIFRRRLAELDRIKIRSGATVETPQQERQRLAEVAETDAGAWEAVEQSAEDQPQGMRSGFEGPFPGRAPQSSIAVEHRCRSDRIHRMQVDERAERLRALPEWIQ